MARKKKEEKKDNPSPKKIETTQEGSINIKKYSVFELLEMNNIKPLNAVGFLEQYGLVDEFKKEVENGENSIKFSEGEFNDMYERYMRREI